jgi:hypothetical protein
MATPQERAENTEALGWLRTIAAGNAAAHEFLLVMWNWTHVLDDLVDGDKPVTIDTAAQWFIELVRVLTFSSFFRDNAPFLFGLVQSMVQRWVAGEKWKDSPNEDERRASAVVRCGDVDLYLGVAYLVGGWEHARACAGARSYDFDKGDR